MSKNYNNTYIYTKFPYEENIFKFLMTATKIETVDSKFDDIRYDFKRRQINSSLLKILCSKNVNLMIAENNIPLNSQFRVLCSRDPKTNTNDYKVFIDCTGLIVKDSKSGNWKCVNIDTLISHTINAMVCMIYHKAEKEILSANLVQDTMSAFSALFTHVIDYLFKVSVIPSTKMKCQYLACMYFIVNILEKEFNEGYKHMASKVVNLSDREQEMIINTCEETDFDNIRNFINKIGEVLKQPAIKVDNVVDKWIYLYGSNTVFALEYYPALSAMLTDAYCGAYINNQKTIEKVVGNTLVSYTKNIVAKGGTLV